ncbi:MAG: endonuclease/exonuclease/phosphatase family protein [Oscillospiraceae bacterium]|nr:endonuclease/exonuclease/phosphatase family protein [Oscillospiraceae bacterium]
MQITCMSYNVLHFERWCTGEIDYDAFADVIRQSGADVVGLNEVYGASGWYGAQAEKLAARLGWHAYFAEGFLDEDAHPFGNAIVSRCPIDEAQNVRIPDPDVRKGTDYYEPRCVLRARIAGHTFLVTHFGLNPDEQQNALETVLPLLENRRCVLMGDFNVTPDNAVLPPIREKMQDADAFLPQGTMSFPADVPRKKIDYIFTSRDYTVRTAKVLPVVVSDHRPYLVTLAF